MAVLQLAVLAMVLLLGQADDDSLFECDFDDGLCGVMTDFNRKSGPTNSGGTGPEKDHTSGSGSYLYMEVSGMPKHHSVSYKIPDRRRPGRLCLEFWYHMHGLVIGSLDVHVPSMPGPDVLPTLRNVWHLEGDQGNFWQLGRVPLYDSSLATITATKNESTHWQGDIAIDDLKVTEGACTRVPADMLMPLPPVGPAPGLTSGGRISIQPGAPISPPVPVQNPAEPSTDTSQTSGDMMCDFESQTDPWCGWKYQSPWTLRSKPTPSSGTGPNHDHTTVMNMKGNYAYYEATTPPQSPRQMQAGDAALLTSPNFPQDGDHCLQFWYHMNGANMGSLQVLSTNNIPLWHRAGHQGATWMEAETFIPSSFKSVVFNATRGNGYQSDIALDDIRVMPGKCPSMQQGATDRDGHSGGDGNTQSNTDGHRDGDSNTDGHSDGDRDGAGHGDGGKDGDGMQMSGKTTCDFEDGTMCNLHAVMTAPQWRTHRGGSPSTGTGPSVDHTLGTTSGSYVYYEGSDRSVNYMELLTADEFAEGGPHCVTFWYHMFGMDMGELSVMAYDPMTKQTGARLWHQKGAKGDMWLEAKVDVQASARSIAFQATQGSWYTSDIALDDITFMAGTCYSQGLTPSCDPSLDPNCQKKTDVNNGGIPVSPQMTMCDFEDGTSGMCMLKAMGTTWKKHSGATGSSNTGPSMDHTTGSNLGHYVYFETSSNQNGDEELLVGEEFPQTGTHCVAFWYHMYGDTVGDLSLHSFRRDVNRTDALLWIRKGNQMDQWHEAKVDIPDYVTSVAFRGKRGASYTGDMALDDVMFMPGSCPSSPSPTSTTTQPTVTCDLSRDPNCQQPIPGASGSCMLAQLPAPPKYGRLHSMVSGLVATYECLPQFIFAPGAASKVYCDLSTQMWISTPGECKPVGGGTMKKPGSGRRGRGKSQAVRLVDGPSSMEGRLEVLYNNTWGTVCKDGWTDREARVVCASMGHTGPAYAILDLTYGVGQGPITVDGVHCDVMSRDLNHCCKNELFVHDCTHADDVGIKCSDDNYAWDKYFTDCDARKGSRDCDDGGDDDSNMNPFEPICEMPLISKPMAACLPRAASPMPPRAGYPTAQDPFARVMPSPGTGGDRQGWGPATDHHNRDQDWNIPGQHPPRYDPRHGYPRIPNGPQPAPSPPVDPMGPARNGNPMPGPPPVWGALPDDDTDGQHGGSP